MVAAGQHTKVGWQVRWDNEKVVIDLEPNFRREGQQRRLRLRVKREGFISIDWELVCAWHALES